jgi:hypothetical protein
MSCSKGFFGLFSVNSPECGANKVELSNSVYNQLNNLVSQNINSGTNVSNVNNNKISIETGPDSEVNCSIDQTNTSSVKIVNNITAEQKATFLNAITNDVKSSLTQEQQQAVLQAFEGEGKSNIAEIDNDLKTIISNTAETSLNSFINTATINQNEVLLKVLGKFNCPNGVITQRNISDIQIDNFVKSMQDALSQNDVINTISNAISQTNTSGLADIFVYIIIGAVILGIVAIIGGGIFAYMKSKNKNKPKPLPSSSLKLPAVPAPTGSKTTEKK